MLSRLKIGHKIVMSFSILLLLSGFIGFTGYRGLNNIFEKTEEVGQTRLPSIYGLLTISSAQRSVITGERGLVNRRFTGNVRTAQYDYIQNSLQMAKKGWDVYEPLPQTKEEDKIWLEFKSAWDSWRSESDKVVSLSKNKDAMLTQGLSSESEDLSKIDTEIFNQSMVSRTAYLKTEELLNKLVEINRELALKDVKLAGEAADSSTKTLFAVIIFSIIVGIILSLIFNKNISSIISSLLSEVENINDSISNGLLDRRIDEEKINFEFRPIVKTTNSLINTFVSPINVMAEYVDRISKGNIPPKITDNYKGDFVEVKNNLNNCIDIMNSLINETETLTKGIENGKLDIRSDASRFMGSWGSLVKGINDLVDTFIAPINTMAEYVEKISRGEIPAKIRDEYKGDFKEVKENLNSAIDALNGLVEVKKVLAKMAGNDFTDEVKGTYLGVYEDVKQSVNLVSDRLRHVQDIIVNISNGDTGDLEKLRKGGKRSEKDNLVPSFIMMLESLTALIKGVEGYAELSSKGELEKINLDESRMKGAYREIFAGLNKAVKSTVEPLMETLSVLKKMERGDFTGEITGKYDGSFLMLKNAVNNSISSISTLLGEVTNTTAQVSSGSQQVSSASQTLSQGATEQASSLEEISSSMQEIAGQTGRNAENAVEANGLAVETTSVAEKGTGQMNQLLNAMSEIQKSSNEISKIIKVIDEIAFQTNLLALNAAVEAARAGIHGKGFAVVAEEVRNLAARSAKAAKETGEMIENAVQKSNAGAEMSKDTAAILSQIVSNISKVSNIVAEIAAASNEQAQGASQINIGLSQVEQVTQSNTASAEQCAAASEELSSQAAYLESMLKKFVLKDDMRSFKSQGSIGMRARQSSAIENKPSRRVQTPEEIISLDDDSFGKY